MKFAESDECVALAATGTPPLMTAIAIAIALCIAGVALARYRTGSRRGSAGAAVVGIMVVGLLAVGPTPSAQAADCGPDGRAPHSAPDVLRPSEDSDEAPSDESPSEEGPSTPAPTTPAPTAAPTSPAPTSPAPTTAPTSPAPTTPAPTPTPTPSQSSAKPPIVHICEPLGFDLFGTTTVVSDGAASTELLWQLVDDPSSWEDNVQSYNAEFPDKAVSPGPVAAVTQSWRMQTTGALSDGRPFSVEVPIDGAAVSYSAPVRTVAGDPLDAYRIDQQGPSLPDLSTADFARYSEAAAASATARWGALFTGGTIEAEILVPVWDAQLTYVNSACDIATQTLPSPLLVP